MSWMENVCLSSDFPGWTDDFRGPAKDVLEINPLLVLLSIGHRAYLFPARSLLYF